MVTDREGAEALAAEFGGVLSRAHVARFGFDRDRVLREVRGRRWALHGRHTVALHTGPIGDLARHWRAVWEVGHSVARLDGVTALLDAGLKGFSETLIHVSVTRNSRCPLVEGVRIHRVPVVHEAGPRRIHGSGPPRVPLDVATLRGAHWAVSDRQAALILLMSVQQGFTTGSRLLATSRSVRGRSRRHFIRATVLDLVDGVQSLGELDFAALCRAHGLPEPERQVVRRGPRGRIYLDVRWRGATLVVEIDGAGHRWGLQVTSDNLRQNAVTLTGDRVLRIDTIGLRLEPAAFMEQVRLGLRRFGTAQCV